MAGRSWGPLCKIHAGMMAGAKVGTVWVVLGHCAGHVLVGWVYLKQAQSAWSLGFLYLGQPSEMVEAEAGSG